MIHLASSIVVITSMEPYFLVEPAEHALQPPALSDGIGKPYFIRSDQYQLRSLRWNGSQRYRMDPDLCGEQPGGI